MTCEFVSRGAQVACRTCGLVLGALGPADCPRRRKGYGFTFSLPAAANDVLPVVSAAPGGPISSRPDRPSLIDRVHLTAPP